MASTPSGIISSVKHLLNDTSSFYDDQILYSWLDEAQSQLSALLNISETYSDQDTVANQRGYDKPSDLVSIVRVEWDNHPLRRIKIENIDNVEGIGYGSPQTYGQPTCYYEYGSKIYLSSIPTTVKNLRIYYINTPTSIYDIDVTTETKVLNSIDLSSIGYQMNDAWVDLHNIDDVDVLPSSERSNIIDFQLIINGQSYPVIEYIQPGGAISTFYLVNQNNGFKLDYNYNSDYVRIYWDNSAANGGFDIQSDFNVIFRYYTTENVIVASAFTIPNEYVPYLESYVLYKMYERDGNFANADRNYNKYLQGIEMAKSIRANREQDLVDYIVNKTDPIGFDCGIVNY